jgi:hypothetical protein
LDSLIPASKISTLTQGFFVGAVSDNFDERIQQKIFHSEIIVDNVKLSQEMKSFQQIPIRSFIDEDGNDSMTRQIQDNYREIKSDILNIITDEMDRIKNDPDLQHLLKSD